MNNITRAFIKCKKQSPLFTAIDPLTRSEHIKLHMRMYDDVIRKSVTKNQPVSTEKQHEK